MQHLLQFFALLPFLGLAAALLAPRKREPLVAAIALGTVGLQLAGLLAFTANWLLDGAPTLAQKQWTLYRSEGFEFYTAYFFDKTTAVFALLGTLLALLVGRFSQFYMHREDGFKRYFCTFLLFFAGYNLTVFAGNLETLFVGWEVLGITSFLLIAFFRDRYLPVRNAFKVLSFYRLGDVCLLLAMWALHHLFHKNTAFAEWLAPGFVQTALNSGHGGLALFAASMIGLAAVIKSAQLPFSTWLPRAMEGPTSSSAVFYGSLAVHIGAFLLIRTAPFWESFGAIKIALIAIGASTALVAAAIARVQSSVKSQIAYASISQIGLIFIEIALGWHGLALLHFAGNACLRTFQLLVSPSVLSYVVHDMFFTFRPGQRSRSALGQAVYVLSIKEFNLDRWLNGLLWQPFKAVGNFLVGLKRPIKLEVLLVALALATEGFSLKSEGHAAVGYWAELSMAAAALFLVIKALAQRGDARRAWLLLVAGQFLVLAGMLFLEPVEWPAIAAHASGTVAGAAAGLYFLQKVHSLEGPNLLDRYHGHAYEHRGLALGFLLCCLALAGFPLTPTFLGVDLIFTKIGADDWLLASLLALNFLFLELAALRIMVRVFWGPHRKMYHPVAFRSS